MSSLGSTYGDIDPGKEVFDQLFGTGTSTTNKILRRYVLVSFFVLVALFYTLLFTFCF